MSMGGFYHPDLSPCTCYSTTLSPGVNGGNHDASLAVVVGCDDAVVRSVIGVADCGVYVGFDGPLRQDRDWVHGRILFKLRVSVVVTVSPIGPFTNYNNVS